LTKHSRYLLYEVMHNCCYFFCNLTLFSCFLGLYNVLRLPLWVFFQFRVISLFNNRFNRYRMETYMFILTKLNRRKSSNNCTGPHREDIDYAWSNCFQYNLRTLYKPRKQLNNKQQNDTKPKIHKVQTNASEMSSLWNESEPRCSGRVSSSCLLQHTRRIGHGQSGGSHLGLL
jgi:hypothetical protein